MLTLVLHTDEGVPASTASRPSCTIANATAAAGKGDGNRDREETPDAQGIVSGALLRCFGRAVLL